jgi:hypothetical protein
VTLTNSLTSTDDIFYARYNASTDAFTWAKSAGSAGSGSDRARAICSNGSGSVFISGLFGVGTASFPTASTALTLTNSRSNGGSAFLAGINTTTGNASWVTMGTTDNTTTQDNALNAVVSSGNNIWVTGTYTSNITFSPLASLASASGVTQDVLVAKLAVPPPLTATQSQVNLSCNGVCNGSATVVASGGTSPYTYSWSPSGGSGATASSLCATNYIVTITDAASTSITKSFTITQPSAITTPGASSNSPVCIGNTINLSTPAVAGATYGWTGPSSFVSAVQNPTRTGATVAMGGTYSVTVTVAGCTSAAGTVAVVVPSAINTTTGSQTNVSCNGGANGSASVTPSGGTPGYTYSWSPSGGSAATAPGLAAGSYTVTVTDASGCTGTRPYIINEPANTPGSNSYTLPGTNQTVIRNAGANYVTASCELVSSVLPSGGNPVSGSVTSKVWIEGAVPTQSGVPFVARHYEITPAISASTATGTITLYFTQTEFDNFNGHAASLLDLPANAGDNVGKSNLRIGKYSGISGNGTGLPASYSSSTMVIDPDDNDIVWNAVSSAWEITFAVDGFSGFVVQTAMFTLPVTWVSFTVKKQGQSVLLNWSTAAEQHTKDFSVQHSTDGISWNTVAILPAAGNSNSPRDYAYLHTSPAKEDNYYRIIQTDLDGKFSYSEVRTINLSGNNTAFTIAGNRISNGVLQLQVHQQTTISLYEVNGKLLWTKQFTPGLQTMNVNGYAKGVYLLKAEGKAHKILSVAG